MTDLVDELKAEAFNDTYDVKSDRVTVQSSLLSRAAAEIVSLMTELAMLKASGPSFREIKQEIKNGPSV